MHHPLVAKRTSTVIKQNLYILDTNKFNIAFEKATQKCTNKAKHCDTSGSWKLFSKSCELPWTSGPWTLSSCTNMAI